jgi:asparagine synthase (glutamine-hydrolysing)
VHRSEVFDIDPAVPPAMVGRAHLCWAAPGSMQLDLVAEAWSRRGRLTDLGTVTGPWGVVLWDPAAKTYLAACDPIGVQPLYWTRTTTGALAVASWMAPLVDRDDVDDTPDPDGVLLDSLLNTRGEGTLHRTRFRNVHKVPFGRALRFTPDGAQRTEKYWDPRSLPGPDESLTPEACVEITRSLLDTAVHRALVGPGPFGSHLSGGLDCTSIAVLADRELQARDQRLVAGYSWSPHLHDVPLQPEDERHLLAAIEAAQSFPVRLLPNEHSGAWFEALDRNRYPSVTLRRESGALSLAAAEGVRVMLSGWGGDELLSFNGRGVLRALADQRRYRTIWRHLEARLGRDGPVRRRHLLSAFADIAAPNTTGTIKRSLRPALRARHRRLAESDLRIDAALEQASPFVAEVRRERLQRMAAVENHHQFQLELFTGGHLQRRTAAWYQAGRAMNVEYRYPLLDLDIVRAAFAMPWWAYRSDGWTRIAYRRAVEPVLPPVVAWHDDKTEPSAARREGPDASSIASSNDNEELAGELTRLWVDARR